MGEVCFSRLFRAGFSLRSMQLARHSFSDGWFFRGYFVFVLAFPFAFFAPFRAY
jgi:hypothetical protein